MKRLSIFVLLCLASPVSAQIYMGNASVIDGDTLELGGDRIRLHGIDAPESHQTCQRNGEQWACGQAATDLLQELVQGQQIQCQQRDRDVYGRIVATCRAGRVDVAEAMASAGLAVALPQYSEAYALTAERARTHRAGIWAGNFQAPADFRATDPESQRQSAAWEQQQQARRMSEARADRQPRGSQRATGDQSVYYTSCRAARAAGAAPLYRGQPGYRPQMDGDNDGVACEPPRRQ